MQLFSLPALVNLFRARERCFFLRRDKEASCLNRQNTSKINKKELIKSSQTAEIQKNLKKIHRQPIRAVFQTLLKGNITKHVKKFAYIVTDTASAYGGLNCMGYAHLTVNHSAEEYSRGDGIHANTIEGLWRNQKKILYGIHHGVSKKYLFGYVSEFLLKFNLKQARFTFPTFLNLFINPPLTC